jgi:hypothetical protein
MKIRAVHLPILAALAAVLSIAGTTFSSGAAPLSLRFAWTQNTEPNLAGYKVYWGPASRSYTNSVVLGKVGTYTLSNLPNAPLYFALSAFNSDNMESAFSAELGYTNPPALGPIADRTIAEDIVTTIPLHVTDLDTPIANVTLSAVSSNLVLVPAANITFSGTGTNRTMVITPAANRAGSADITVTASDGVFSASRSFVLTVGKVPDAPLIASIDDVITDEDIFPPTISFTVSDADTATTNLTVQAASTNPTLIGTNRIVLGGTNGTRTVRLRPSANQHGSAVITLTVSDPGGLSSSTSFDFTVRPVNDPPIIGQLNDRTPLEDTQIGPINFMVDDVDNPATSLTVTATSSNPNIVPQANLFLNGSGTNRTIQVRPATNAVGSTLITLTVSDGQANASESFTVTYTAVNDEPFVSQPPDLTVNKPSPVPPIPFTIWDAETAPSLLVITLTSTNTTLLPTNNMVVSGTGSNRVLTLTPAPNQFGSSRIGIRVSDGTSNNLVRFVFTYTSSNTAPVLTVPGSLAGGAGTVITILGVAVADLDAGTNNLNLTLSAANGTISVATAVAGGVRATQVSGNNSAAVTIVAPLAALNATLSNPNGLSYTSRSDFNGTENLLVAVNDNGHSGTGGAKTDSETITIQIASGSSLDLWRESYFTAADLEDPAREATVWGELADPDNDGRHNLMEFALGLHPLGSEPQELAFVTAVVTSGGNQYLTLTFNSRINEPLIQYIPEVSADNTTWSATTQRTASTPVNAVFERVTYRDSVPITSEAARFIRLRVVKNSP